ncbi:hypothetical protein NM688_g1307 [Phlebia brevispora]|uniref:Uncharacterized protein n=1 Tax=Phlebia brevispora TaxID=194682 RepID=A0ACC1TCH8_9APHY|nr:hypothetical protein NM688_g1307 [Phlebia brevispora]
MGKVASWLTSFVLFLIHVGYALVNAATSLRKGYCARDPLPLAIKRKQVPSHIALLFASHDDTSLDRFEGEMLDNIEEVVAWCQVVGIKRLTVYDRKGVLSRSSFALRERLQPEELEDDVSASESDIDYPLTPPLSDDSGSRPLSPQRDTPPKLHVTSLCLGRLESPAQATRRRRSLTKRHPHHKNDTTQEEPFCFHVISRQSGKAAISNTATSLSRQHCSASHSASDNFTVTQNEVNSILEGAVARCNALQEGVKSRYIGQYGFPSPELMIIHNILPNKRSKSVLELHGFPPWQIRLTEFYHTQYPRSSWSRWRLLWKPKYIAVDEVEFRRALDEFAAAEMRLGK